MPAKQHSDRDDPKRALPNTEIEDARRLNVLRESEEPHCAKSNTDREEPKREQPKREIDAPMRANRRRDNEDAKCK